MRSRRLKKNYFVPTKVDKPDFDKIYRSRSEYQNEKPKKSSLTSAALPGFFNKAPLTHAPILLMKDFILNSHATKFQSGLTSIAIILLISNRDYLNKIFHHRPTSWAMWLLAFSLLISISSAHDNAPSDQSDQIEIMKDRELDLTPEFYESNINSQKISFSLMDIKKVIVKSSNMKEKYEKNRFSFEHDKNLLAKLIMKTAKESKEFRCKLSRLIKDKGLTFLICDHHELDGALASFDYRSNTIRVSFQYLSSDIKFLQGVLIHEIHHADVSRSNKMSNMKNTPIPCNIISKSKSSNSATVVCDEILSIQGDGIEKIFRILNTIDKFDKSTPEEQIELNEFIRLSKTNPSIDIKKLIKSDEMQKFRDMGIFNSQNEMIVKDSPYHANGFTFELTSYEYQRNSHFFTLQMKEYSHPKKLLLNFLFLQSNYIDRRSDDSVTKEIAETDAVIYQVFQDTNLREFLFPGLDQYHTERSNDTSYRQCMKN